ncbi:MAG TPA: uridine kinase [Bacillota bacterium]|nr:uridine kinase [Bacillota bacterium]
MSQAKPTPILVGIVGGSGSGKSWLADKLLAALDGQAVRLSLDNFYLDRSHLPPARRARLNFDHPRAIDWPRVEQVLADLLASRPARVPDYDFKTHCRLAGDKLLQPKPIILMEGLWLLRRASLRRRFSLRIFLDCPTRTRLRRRLARDLQGRGRTRQSIQEQFWNTVEPMHQVYVAPQIGWADLVLAQSCSERQAEQLAARLQTLPAEPHPA